MSYNTKLFIVTAVLYGLHFIAKRCSFPEPIFISSYFADMLCLPFTLSFFVLIVRIVKRQPMFQLSIAMIAFAVIYVSFMFEYLLPKYYSWLTADTVDIAMYALGGVFYYCFQKWERRRFRPTTP